MVDISIAGDHLRIEVLGWSKLWSFKRRLEPPLACVRSVQVGGELPKGFWLRWPGASIPGVIEAGSYTDLRRWSFWDIGRDRSRVIVIRLSGWKYDYMVVSVSDPRAVQRMLRAALPSLEISGQD